jgi:hypothetical protein
MKNILYLALLTVFAMGSCSNPYKLTQTPDDVYYSPAQGEDGPRYQDNYASSDDRYLRMKTRDNSRWSSIDDYDYWYDSRYYYNNYSYNAYAGNAFNYGGIGSMYPSFGFNPYLNYFNPYNNYMGSYLGYGYGYGGFYPSTYYPFYPVVYYKNPRSFVSSSSNNNIRAYRNNTFNNYNRGDYRYNNANNNDKRYSTPAYNPSYSNPNTGRSTGTPSGNSNAGGRSGGYNSSGSSAGSSRAPR